MIDRVTLSVSKICDDCIWLQITDIVSYGRFHAKVQPTGSERSCVQSKVLNGDLKEHDMESIDCGAV